MDNGWEHEMTDSNEQPNGAAQLDGDTQATDVDANELTDDEVEGVDGGFSLTGGFRIPPIQDRRNG